MKRLVIQLILFLLPWRLRRVLLCKIFHFEIAPTARLGFSIILANELRMKDFSKIGHLTFCKQIDLIELGEHSHIGTRNYITGFSSTIPKFQHFSHIPNRKCILVIGQHTGITSRHYFDCNGGIYIGNFCQIAGFESAFMSHSIDLKNNRQDAEEIRISDYVFVGTRCTILKGSFIPSHSIIAACSLVNKKFTTEDSLYGGIPCKFIKKLEDYKFFTRNTGHVI